MFGTDAIQLKQILSQSRGSTILPQTQRGSAVTTQLNSKTIKPVSVNDLEEGEIVDDVVGIGSSRPRRFSREEGEIL